MTTSHDDAASAFGAQDPATIRRQRRQLRQAIDKLEAELLTVSRAATKLLKRSRIAELKAELAQLPPDDDSDDDEPDMKQSERIVALCGERFDVFPSTEEGNGLVLAVERGGPNLAFPIRGAGGLRQRLAAAYRAVTGAVPSTNALVEALTVIEGEAFGLEPRDVRRRVAWHAGTIVVDLGEPTGAAAVITAGGWQVVERSPVTFIRSHSLTLPLPVAATTTSWRAGLKPLRDLVNVSDADWTLIVAWLIHGLMADQPHAILRLSGEQGAAKSTAANLLVSTLDPSTSILRSEPANRKDWAVCASGSWAFALDNLSHVEPWFSDALCRAATGEAFVSRALYSDADVSVLKVQRCIVITTIGLYTTPGDLAERTIPIELTPPTVRLTDEEVRARFDAARATVSVALFDLASKVLAGLPFVLNDRLPRMADYARTLRAVSALLSPDDPDAGPDRYVELLGELMAEVAEGNPLAVALTKFIDSQPGRRWTGTASELLDKMNLWAPSGPTPKGWPRTPRAIGVQLTRLAPALRRAGLDIERTHSGNRTIRIALSHDE